MEKMVQSHLIVRNVKVNSRATVMRVNSCHAKCGEVVTQIATCDERYVITGLVWWCSKCHCDVAFKELTV